MQEYFLHCGYVWIIFVASAADFSSSFLRLRWPFYLFMSWFLSFSIFSVQVFTSSAVQYLNEIQSSVCAFVRIGSGWLASCLVPFVQFARVSVRFFHAARLSVDVLVIGLICSYAGLISDWSGPSSEVCLGFRGWLGGVPIGVSAFSVDSLRFTLHTQ